MNRLINNACSYHLRSCVWEITLSCCFSCKYCGSRAGNARQNELSTDECIEIVRQLDEMGCQRVSLIGGEVFMRQDWELIIKALTDRNIKVNIITNGYIFTDNLVSRLKALNIESVSVSLDGPEEIHDSFRERGSFSRAIRAIEMLSDKGIPVSVISTLHSRNYKSLPQMYKILKPTKIYAWQLQACSPMGNASDDGFSTAIDFLKVIKFVEDTIDSSPFVIGIADNIGYYTEGEKYLRGNKNAFFRGCTAGLTSVGIDSVGNVRGCESMYDDSFIEGNLRKQSLFEIWNSPTSFSYNRQFTVDKLGGQCKECEFGVICAGGCRSYNFFAHGNMFSSLYCARKVELSK